HQGADVRQYLVKLARHRLAQHLDLAPGGVDQAEQHAYQRGLTGAVRAEQAIPVAGPHIEVDRVDGEHRAKALRDRSGDDHAGYQGSAASGGAARGSPWRPTTRASTNVPAAALGCSRTAVISRVLTTTPVPCRSLSETPPS